MTKKIYLYKAIDENNEVMAETLFRNLDDAIDQLKIDEKDYDLSYTPIYQTKSKFIISLPTPKQVKRLLKKGVKIY
jgi:hypothetical protein